MLDHDALLRFKLFDQAGDLLQRSHAVEIAVDKQAGGRAGGQERVVETVGRRRDRNEALDLGTPHQKLHPDPGTERHTGDPAGARLGIDGLSPVERGRRVRKLAGAVIERALAAADASKIEAQHREPTLREGVIEMVDDLIVHRPAELRVRVQHDGYGRAARRGLMKAALQPAGRASEDDFGHLPPQ